MPLDRERENSTFYDTTCVLEVGPDQPSGSSHTVEYGVTHIGKYSRIWDSSDHALDERGYRQKPCTHYQVTPRVVAGPASVWDRGTHPYGITMSWISPEIFTPLRVDQLRYYWSYPSVPNTMLREFSREALEVFTTQIPQKISIGNFLWELREMAAMLPRLADTLLSSIAGGYLSYEFGSAPFFSDLKTLANLNQSVEDRLSFLRKTRKKVTRLGHAKKHTLTFDSYVYDTNLTGWQGFIDPGTVDLRLIAGCKFTHDIPWLDTVHGKLRAFGSALGLNNPVLAVWQALPFSFMVDWFVDVGGMLSDLDLQDETAGWKVWDLTWSAEFSWVDKVYQRSYDYSGSLVVNWPITDLLSSFYTRSPGYPEIGFLASLDPESLSPKQLSLLLALILAN